MSDSVSSEDYGNLEHKYVETKSKLKKTLQYNEKYNIQIQKLNKRIKRLENENKELELKAKIKEKDSSESELSSSVNLHHQNRANMVDLVHSKNQQISELLKDIEQIDNENVTLKDKLTEAKEQLVSATKEITEMTETLKDFEEQAHQRDNLNEKLNADILSLKEKCELIKKEKYELERSFLKDIELIKCQENGLKILIEVKDEEIEKLKLSLNKKLLITETISEHNDKIDSTDDTLSTHEAKSLKLTLEKTESQLAELKFEMKNSTVELKECTKIINKLKNEKETLSNNLKIIKEKKNDLNEQLKKSHERCRILQNEVEFANKMTKIFENDLSDIKEQLSKEGHVDVVKNLEEIQSIKIEKLLHEKQIVGFVKDINKLQESFNLLEVENKNLREELQLSSNDSVDINPNLQTKSHKLQKMIEKLKLEKKEFLEEKVILKMQIKQLKVNRHVEQRKESPEANNSNNIKLLFQENERLKNRLQEILDNVQQKTDEPSREWKTDDLEKLFESLDISKWNPSSAMRLQDELRTLEGINCKLRQQLQEARTELEKKTDLLIINNKDNNKTQFIERDSTSHIVNILNNKNACIEKLKVDFTRIMLYFLESQYPQSDIELRMQEEFEHISSNIDQLHANCNKEKENLMKQIQQEIEIISLDKSLSNLTNNEIEELLLKYKRKSEILFEKMLKLEEELFNERANTNNLIKINSVETDIILKKLISAYFKLDLKNTNNLMNEAGVAKEIQHALNDSLQKQRSLLTKLEELENNYQDKIRILQTNENDSIKENNELKERLQKALNKVYQEIYRHDSNVTSLSQRLAATEVQALSEKNRADHTNNLYELVKEQLRKSEEKFIEFSKYSENLLQKNLILQDRVANLEDQSVFLITADLHKELENKLNFLIQENEFLLTENASLQEKVVELENMKQIDNWNKEKEQEILGLKHEIVDLAATSDDKTVIDNIYCDLNKARAEYRENQIKLDFLKKEIGIWETRYKKLSKDSENRSNEINNQRNILQQKIHNLQNIIMKQRIQFHGCVPLILQEHFIQKMQSIISADKLETSSSTTDNNKPFNIQQETEYLHKKIQKQDKEIEKLELALFEAYQLVNFSSEIKSKTRKTPKLIQQIVTKESFNPEKEIISKMTILRNVEMQTDDDLSENFEIQISNLQNLITLKNNQILANESLNLKNLHELEESRSQLRMSKEQINTLENSLKKIEEKSKVSMEIETGGGDGVGRTNPLNEQIITLTISLRTLQERLTQKDQEIIKYQTLLKTDRDKHSMAATNLQKELFCLKNAFLSEQQNLKSVQQELNNARQKSVVVDKYISQVRALEKHLAELHTEIAQYKAKLENALQESGRWRQMAEDRLIAMQELGKSLNTKHNEELTNLKRITLNLNGEEFSNRERNNWEHIDPDILKICREKDDKIEDLVNKLKQIESRKIETALTPNLNEENITLSRDLILIRRKYENLLKNEKTLKDELKDLKDQLSKKPNLSARNQKSEKALREQLQRKIKSLENEIESLNEKLSQEQIINEKHKLGANEDFAKWKKQKFWQESSEKYKKKLQESEELCKKLQEATSNYKSLIERLEREKISLENRIKSLKSMEKIDEEKEYLKMENEKLNNDLIILQSKLDIRQQTSGSLSATLMQEKLEAQERKIAVLELSSKGSMEIRNELERLQATLSNLQKANLCLEAENLEMKMDLDNLRKENARFLEQIHHLESYIDALNREENKNSDPPSVETADLKKNSQLERTVYILKRVVEKLQSENKRLLSNRPLALSKSLPTNKLPRDYIRLKEQHAESLNKIKTLEMEIKSSKNFTKIDELKKDWCEAKEQLIQKSQLLDKVKTLLHRAAIREKDLLAEISQLKQFSNMENNFQVDIPSTIEETSEVESDNIYLESSSEIILHRESKSINQK